MQASVVWGVLPWEQVVCWCQSRKAQDAELSICGISCDCCSGRRLAQLGSRTMLQMMLVDNLIHSGELLPAVKLHQPWACCHVTDARLLPCSAIYAGLEKGVKKLLLLQRRHRPGAGDACIRLVDVTILVW